MNVEDIASKSRVVMQYDWKDKCVISTFVLTSQQIKEVLANGHEKLNRLMIDQTT